MWPPLISCKLKLFVMLMIYALECEFSEQVHYI